MYGSKIMVWNPKYRFKVQAFQMDYLRGGRELLDMQKFDQMKDEDNRVNYQYMYGVKKGE